MAETKITSRATGDLLPKL